MKLTTPEDVNNFQNENVDEIIDKFEKELKEQLKFNSKKTQYILSIDNLQPQEIMEEIVNMYKGAGWPMIDTYYDDGNTVLVLGIKSQNNEMLWNDILKDLKPEYDDNVIYWGKNDLIYFEQDKEDKTLWCDKKLVWNVFENKDNPNYDETKSLIKNLLLSHDEWKDYNPNWDFYN